MQRVVDLDKAVFAYGGFSGLARRLGEPLSTVHGWARRKRLPPWRARQIIALAKKSDTDVFKDAVVKKAPAKKSKKRGVARRKQVA
jgi:hypothetical protein